MPSKVLGPNRTHGLIATYNCGCRCDECRQASRETRARYRVTTFQREKRMCPFCDHWFAPSNHENICAAERRAA